jgi:hypothetical protein
MIAAWHTWCRRRLTFRIALRHCRTEVGVLLPIRAEGSVMSQSTLQIRSWSLLSLSMAVGLALTGCSGGSGGSAGLTTAAILDGNGTLAPGETPTVAADDPLARPVQVGWTVARAQKCGFNFDSAKVRAAFLASETQRGVAGDMLGKIEKSYDQTVSTVRGNIAGDGDYCNDKRSAVIKADLQRHLAGDYSPKLQEPKKKAASGGFFEGWGEPDNSKFDPKTIWQELKDKKDGTRTGG